MGSLDSLTPVSKVPLLTPSKQFSVSRAPSTYTCPCIVTTLGALFISFNGESDLKWCDQLVIPHSTQELSLMPSRLYCTIYQSTLVRMLSAKDRRLLERSAPELRKFINIEGSDILEQLIKRGALRQQHKELIKVCLSNCLLCYPCYKMIKRLFHAA